MRERWSNNFFLDIKFFSKTNNADGFKSNQIMNYCSVMKVFVYINIVILRALFVFFENVLELVLIICFITGFSIKLSKRREQKITEIKKRKKTKPLYFIVRLSNKHLVLNMDYGSD